jgi:hypothetical protein
MNTALGPEIFSKLSGGCAINKNIYANGVKLNNPLYDELFIHKNAYQDLYSSIGFVLVVAQDYFIMKDRSDEPSADVAMKVAVLIEVIARKMAGIPLHAEALIDFQVGLDKQKIAELEHDDEVQKILKACGMKANLSTEVQNVLVGRDIAFWNQREALVLSDAGIDLFNSLFGDEWTKQSL